MHREQSGGEQQPQPRQPSFASVGAQKVRRRHPLRQGGEGGERTDVPRSLLRGRREVVLARIQGDRRMLVRVAPMILVRPIRTLCLALCTPWRLEDQLRECV